MLESIKYSSLYPKGAMLFVEGQSPRGVFVLCTGRVKLSTCSSDGKTLMRIAEPGDVIGLSAAVSGKPYELSAETLNSCQVNFIRRDDFLRFLRTHGEVCLRVSQHLSNDYHTAYEQVRSLALSHSAAEKLARLLLNWCDEDGKPTDQGIRLKLTLTHEEMAQMIGASRETVTRLLGEFRTKQVIHLKGSNLLIRNKGALQAMVNC
jgi:CRP/FNR family transcriptional regulator